MSFREYLENELNEGKALDKEILASVKTRIDKLGYKFKQSKKGYKTIFTADEILKTDEAIYALEINVWDKKIDMKMAKYNMDKVLQGYQTASETPFSNLTVDNVDQGIDGIEKAINTALKIIKK